MTLDSDITDNQCTYLIDSQADIAILKESAVNNFEAINKHEIIDIKGVTDGFIESLGTIDAVLMYNGHAIPQAIHIVPNNFNIEADGIIGKDFLRGNLCNIDYDKMSLTIKYDGNKIEIPFYGGPDEDTIVLPARSETIRQVKLKKGTKGVQLIESQEMGDGVMIARTIVDTNKPLVRVINTTSVVQTLKLREIESESLEKYNIYTIDDIQKEKERKKKLIEEVTKNTPKQYEQKVASICAEFNDIFALESDKMTVNNFYTQKLKLNDDSPVYVKNYRLPYSQRDEIQRQVEKLMKNDLIEPSSAAYKSPILLVPKKSENGEKKWRLCIDYRLVNKKLVADKYPLPRIEDILDSLGRAKHFSIVDLFSGFHQIPIEENSRDLTTFSTAGGSFRWKVVPFGLNVSPN